ncbi:MAG TPA: hypothetical protein VN420_02375 [Candidatus Fimivivens sp.]|nr:hypothetical protein [Candidatus Fimivivens sp.]
MITFLPFLLVTLAIPAFGHLLIWGLFGPSFRLSPLERLTFSFVLGIGSLDFSMMAIGRAGVGLTVPVLLLALTVVPIASAVLRLIFLRFFISKRTPINSRPDTFGSAVRFSDTERAVFLLLFGLTVFLKTFYLFDAGLPTATDLGHHMYWSKVIVDTGRLPDYSKREIVDRGDGHTSLSAPEPISDFIIGEHLPFAAIAKLSGSSFFSAFPISFLLLVNLLSIIALFVLSVRLSVPLFRDRDISPVTAGLAVLFFAGPLFTLASPETKFVSGGVVGNLFGNLMIPLVILSFFRAFTEEDSRFLGLGLLVTLTLAYTHHLSAFVLGFSIFGTAISLIGMSFRNLSGLLKKFLRLFMSPYPALALVFAGSFFFLIAMPTYIETNAVTTAVGTPLKSTRTGLTFLQATQSTGTARMAIGIAALVLAAAIRPLRRSVTFPFLLGWGGILLLMTIRPGWLFLNIPSDRIGTYLSFPMTILAGLFLAAFPSYFRNPVGRISGVLLPGTAFLFASLILFSFPAWDGSQDNQSSLPGSVRTQDAIEVFDASIYLSDHALPGDLPLKDHNYLAADSWMKLLFMKGYSYPLSRGLFKRYEDETNPREQCTLRMISAPNLSDGQTCFADLRVNLLAVNPRYDSSQFEKSHAFSRIFDGTSIQIYERKQ